LVLVYHLPCRRDVILNDFQCVDIERIAERLRHFMRRPLNGRNQMRGRGKNIGVLFLTNHSVCPRLAGLISINASVSSSSYTLADGNSPLTMREKTDGMLPPPDK
jgi:hypothetical protein